MINDVSLLEDRIRFDTDKFSINFGRPFLRTKDTDLQEYNKSFYKHPTNLDTDDFEWTTRSFESNVPLHASNHILTLPKLYEELYQRSPPEKRHSSNVSTPASYFDKCNLPLINHRDTLKKFSHNLKLANDYLEQQRQRFHPNPVDQCTDEELLLTAESNIPSDYNFHCDERLLRSSVFSTGIDGAIQEEEENVDSIEILTYNKHQHPEVEQAFFVDSYTDESVNKLLENIEKLHLDPTAFADTDVVPLTEEGDLDKQNTVYVEYHPELDNKHHIPFTDERRTSVSSVHTVDTSSTTASNVSPTRPKSRTKLIRYDPAFLPANKNEDITKLGIHSEFALSDVATITMRQMDVCVYRNSRRFNPKFDAKVERKKLVLKAETEKKYQIALRAAAFKEKRRAEMSGTAIDSAHGEMKKNISVAAFQSAPSLSDSNLDTDPLLAPIGSLVAFHTPTRFTRRHAPLMPIARIKQQNSPTHRDSPISDISSRSASFDGSPPRSPLPPLQMSPLNGNSYCSTPQSQTHRDHMNISPVRAIHSARDNPKHTGQYRERALAMVNTTETFLETKRLLLLSSEEVHDEAVDKTAVDSTCIPTVKLSAMEIEEDLPPCIIFDVTAKGSIGEVLLKSQQPIPRPNSANKALPTLTQASKHELTKSAQKVKSLLTMAQKRRHFVKHVNDRKDLLTIQMISAEQADIERRALITLFENCNGRNWTDKTNWCSNEPLKKWFGVGVTVEGYVFELDLSCNNLCGEFPDSISLLCKLEVVVLDNNKLHGSLPDYSLSKIPTLTVLSAQHNRLSGMIPFNMLHDLTRLTDMWLSHNEFTGHIQDGIGRLVSLSNLCLYRNQLTGTIPNSICRLTKMEFLSLGNNRLTGPIPHEIISLHQLRTLSLYNNRLSGRIPDWLETIPYLEELELFGNCFEGDVPNTVIDLSVKKKTTTDGKTV